MPHSIVSLILLYRLNKIQRNIQPVLHLLMGIFLKIRPAEWFAMKQREGGYRWQHSIPNAQNISKLFWMKCLRFELSNTNKRLEFLPCKNLSTFREVDIRKGNPTIGPAKYPLECQFTPWIECCPNKNIVFETLRQSIDFWGYLYGAENIFIVI